nr:hypothetical protein [uncultured Marinifilum sp.]
MEIISNCHFETDLKILIFKDLNKYTPLIIKDLTNFFYCFLTLDSHNYENFTKYRDSVTFPDDTSGKIDFAKNDDTGSPQDVKKGNYIKVAEPMYAVQSALWFSNKGTQKDNKYAVEHAENDNVNLVSKAINAFDTGNLTTREGYYNNARKKGAIDIVRHHADIYDNGTDEQKKTSKAYFEKWKDKDEEAKKKLEEINKADKVKTD